MAKSTYLSTGFALVSDWSIILLRGFPSLRPIHLFPPTLYRRLPGRLCLDDYPYCSGDLAGWRTCSLWIICYQRWPRRLHPGISSKVQHVHALSRTTGGTLLLRFVVHQIFIPGIFLPTELQGQVYPCVVVHCDAYDGERLHRISGGYWIQM